MRNGTPQTLVWTSDPNPSNLPCEGDMFLIDVVLEIMNEDESEAFDVTLIHCEASASWYGLTFDLREMLGEIGWEWEEVEAFRVDGEPVVAAMLLPLAQVPMPWAEARKVESRMKKQVEMPTPTQAEDPGASDPARDVGSRCSGGYLDS